MICPKGYFGKNCDTQIPPCPIEDSCYRLMQNRCFYFEKETLTFEAAKANCKEKGGKLYEPKDVTKMKEIAKIADEIIVDNWCEWIGVTDSAVEGTFVYDSDGSSFNEGYRNRYDIIDCGHEEKPFCVFFQKSISTEIKEFATIVLWKLVTNFSYRGRTKLVYISFLGKWRHKILTVFKSF